MGQVNQLTKNNCKFYSQDTGQIKIEDEKISSSSLSKGSRVSYVSSDFIYYKEFWIKKKNLLFFLNLIRKTITFMKIIRLFWI